jgi:apolipoprotein N-acyltransferase
MFDNFREEGETVTVALIQPNLDPYTEKFVPERQAQHLEEFFRTADSICDDETDYLFGPETLIVQQIDERVKKGVKPLQLTILLRRRTHTPYLIVFSFPVLLALERPWQQR